MFDALTHVVVPPEAEPVTLQEARDQLRLETAYDDAQVTRGILAARKYIEEVLWRGLVTQDWELVAPRFPGDHPFGLTTDLGFGFPFFGLDYRPYQQHHLEGIELPGGNLVAVTSVKYVDTTGALQTMVVGTDYVVDAISVPGRVRLAYGKSWPDHRLQWDAVKVVYTVGWNPDEVPEPIKQAMLLLVSHFYENRSLELPGRLSQVQFALDALLNPYRLARFL